MTPPPPSIAGNASSGKTSSGSNHSRLDLRVLPHAGRSVDAGSIRAVLVVDEHQASALRDPRRRRRGHMIREQCPSPQAAAAGLVLLEEQEEQEGRTQPTKSRSPPSRASLTWTSTSTAPSSSHPRARSPWALHRSSCLARPATVCC